MIPCLCFSVVVFLFITFTNYKDFARVAPPTPPTEKGENLFNLFRIEFLRSYKKPLSSDGFSLMGANDPKSKEYCQDIIEAYNYLRSSTIPNFIEQFSFDSSQSNYSLWRQFIGELHSAGINLRLLGYIHSLATMNHPLKDFLLLVALARTAKTMLEEIFREIPSQESQLFTSAAVEFYNLLHVNSCFF